MICLYIGFLLIYIIVKSDQFFCLLFVCFEARAKDRLTPPVE